MHYNRLQQALGFSRVASVHSKSDNDAEASYEEAEITPTGFGSLPLHLLEQIFRKLRHSGRKTQFAVCGVCSSWRNLGQPIFFPKPWDSHHLICHPNQLFCLSPRPLKYSESRSGLLRCFVRREPCSSSSSSPPRNPHHRHLTFWLGKGPTRSSVRFLMSAVQVSRTKTLLYLNSKGTGKPCAILHCNLFGTKYSLHLAGLYLHDNNNNNTMSHTTHHDDDGEEEEDDDDDEDTSTDAVNGNSSTHHHHTNNNTNGLLLQLEYKARIRGFMQPRRMMVSLPHPSTMQCGDPSSLPTLAGSSLNRVSSSCGTAVNNSDSGYNTTTASTTIIAGDGSSIFATSGSGSNVTNTPLPPAPTTATTTTTTVDELLPSGSGRMSRFLLKAWRTPQDVIQKFTTGRLRGKTAPLPSSPPEVALEPVILKNKAPHWNDDLRCWCLNFRGRVKLASVKNFQLVIADDTSEEITMQFGRVDKSTFILDFNPTKMSAVQAFAVALSTFDGKVML